jgi:hypothetical protein
MKVFGWSEFILRVLWSTTYSIKGRFNALYTLLAIVLFYQFQNLSRDFFEGKLINTKTEAT